MGGVGLVALFACAFTATITTVDGKISPDKGTYTRGETIEVTFDGGPGAPTDWIGIFIHPVPPLPLSFLTPPQVAWLYVDGTHGGCEAKAAGTVIFRNTDLSPGTYAIYLLQGDEDPKRVQGPAVFNVTDPSATVPTNTTTAVSGIFAAPPITTTTTTTRAGAK